MYMGSACLICNRPFFKHAHAHLPHSHAHAHVTMAITMHTDVPTRASAHASNARIYTQNRTIHARTNECKCMHACVHACTHTTTC